MRKPKNITNKHFGRLTVLNSTQRRSKSGSVLWICLCDCGNSIEVSTERLNSGKKRSCGCLYKETRVRKHTPEECKKISEANTKRVYSISTIEKIRVSKLGIKNPQYGKHPTKDTIKKLRESRTGDKNWNWKGGITPINFKIRNSFEMKEWIKEVFKKDNYVCQKYGTVGGVLHAHHISNFADFPELRIEVSNGITLSARAHREFHKIYGKEKNNREQILEFINKNI